MTELQYSFQALLGDYGRAALGLAISVIPITVAPSAIYFLGPVALIFAAFALRTAQRQFTRIEVSPERISLFFLRRVTFDWSEVSAVQLNYYSTKRDRTGGWMQLTIRAIGADGARRKIRVDTRLEEFDTVARYAGAAAQERGLTLSAPTIANFMALGVDLNALAAPEPR